VAKPQILFTVKKQIFLWNFENYLRCGTLSKSLAEGMFGNFIISPFLTGQGTAKNIVLHLKLTEYLSNVAKQKDSLSTFMSSQ